MQDTKITAGMVAAELRKLADALDMEPDAISYAPVVLFYCDNKEQFLTAAKALPKPFKKSVDHITTYPRIDLCYRADAIQISASVLQSLTCTLVEPAKPAVFECDPILSAIEEAALEGAA